MVDVKAVTMLRHSLHRHPGVSGQEGPARERVEEFLHECGLEPEARPAGGLLYRIGDGAPRVLMRAELDALPLHEQNEGAHASTIEGAHHACGHDGHMAMLAGAVKELVDEDLDGTLYILFQPDEERGQGMEACLEALGDDFEVDWCFCFHNVPGRPMGEVVVHQRIAAVASTGLSIRFRGATSHAAEPYLGRNPIPVLGRLIQVAEEAPTRRLHLSDPSVVALVGVEGGGERFGTSAGDAALHMTLRAGSDRALEEIVSHVVRHAEAMADADGLEVEWDHVEPFPATHNDEKARAVVLAAAEAAGLDADEPHDPFPWSEDFGHATAKWPGCLVGLGAGEDQASLHSPVYDFPDDLLDEGIQLWTAIVREVMA